MKDTQTRKLNMGVAVLEGLNDTDSDAIISGNPNAVAKRTLLETNLSDIEKADEAQQATSSGGEAITKQEAKHNMADQADVIAQALCSFALDNNNHTLYGQMNKHAPAIESMKDVDAASFAHLVLQNGNDNSTPLLGYNVTALMLTGFATAIQTFEGADAAPRNAQGQHHTATTNVSVGITAMMTTLKWWDHFMATYRVTQHDFYTNYLTWRKVLDIGVRHISVRGLIIDSITSTPLYTVKATVVETGAVTKSGKTGKFRFLSLKPGVYTLTFELKGYQTLTIPNVSIIEGKITELPVSLVKL